MRQQLIQYVELLFAGAGDCEDIKQEILQNTLDRYDDLIAEGKVPEAAYRLAITGIGDINEILGTGRQSPPPRQEPAAQPDKRAILGRKLLRAIAIGLYILCPVPAILFSDTRMEPIGVCGLLAIVAAATVLLLLSSKKEPPLKADPAHPEHRDPQTGLRRSIRSLIWVVGLAAYFLVSFATGAWYITWLMFPITGAVQGVATAVLDYAASLTQFQEVGNHET